MTKHNSILRIVSEQSFRPPHRLVLLIQQLAQRFSNEARAHLAHSRYV